MSMLTGMRHTNTALSTHHYIAQVLSIRHRTYTIMSHSLVGMSWWKKEGGGESLFLCCKFEHFCFVMLESEALMVRSQLKPVGLLLT